MADARSLMETILDHGWHRSPAHDRDGSLAWTVHLHGQDNRLILVHQDTGEVLIQPLEAGLDQDHAPHP